MKAEREVKTMQKGQTYRCVCRGWCGKDVFVSLSILIMKMTNRVEETGDLPE